MGYEINIIIFVGLVSIISALLYFIIKKAVINAIIEADKIIKKDDIK